MYVCVREIELHMEACAGSEKQKNPVVCTGFPRAAS